MSSGLGILGGMELPEAPLGSRARTEASAHPIVRWRRVLRRGQNLVAVAALCIAVGYLWNPEPRHIRLDPQAPKPSKHAGGPLAGQSVEDLLKLRDDLLAKKSRVSGSVEFIPVETLLESSDYAVEGVITHVTVDRNRLAEDIQNMRVGPLYLSVEFTVTDSLPHLDQATIVVSGIGDLEEIAVGKAFLMLLKGKQGVYTPFCSFDAQGSYQIRGTGQQATVSGLLQQPATMSVADAWKLIREWHDRLQGGASENGASDVQAQLSLLEKGSLSEASLALDVLATPTGRKALTADVLMNSLEVHYDRVREQVQVTPNQWSPARHRIPEQVSDFDLFAGRVCELLQPVADDATAARLLKLYVRDMSDVYGQMFNEHDLQKGVFAVVLAPPGASRAERVLSLLGKEVEYHDQQGNRIGGEILMLTDWSALDQIARTPGDDMEALLKDVLDNPSKYHYWSPGGDITPEKRENLLKKRKATKQEDGTAQPVVSLQAFLDQHPEEPTSMPLAVKLAIRQGDRSAIPLLQKLPVLAVADVIWLKTPDPVFLPALRAAATSVNWKDCGRFGPPVLDALDACGASADADQLAAQFLRAAIGRSDLDQLEADIAYRCEALRYLGRAGRKQATELVRPFLEDHTLRPYRVAQQDAYKKTFLATEANRREFLEYRSLERHPLAEDLRMAARLALTRLGEPGMVEKWRTVYAQGDTPDRMTAAIALFYLHDTTGKEMVDAFRNHTTWTLPELHRYFSENGWTRELQNTALYLRSPEMDAMFLEHLRNGLDPGDRDPLLYHSTFLQEYAGQVLPTLLNHLEDRDMGSRQEAHDILEGILKISVKWERGARAGTQPEAVKKLHDATEMLLSQIQPPEGKATP